VCGTPGTTSSTATPCCAGNTCTGGCCVTRYSTTLSSGNQLCMAAGVVCDTLYTSTGNPVCDVTTVAGGSCTGTSTTTPCGGLNQACCVSTYSSSTSYYYCGAPGSRCLTSTSSTTGTTQYLCTACGAKGQRCCTDSPSSSTSSAVGCKAPSLCNYDSTSGYYYCN
jgi:hypothetical protein